VVARIIAPRYSELLGQSVVIENRPGATGTMAAGQVAKSAPDGYTIMMGHVSVNAIAPALFSNLQYDVIKDFAPIGIAAAVPHFVTVHPSVPATSLKELIPFLKSKPDLTFPSAGNGSMPHLAGEIFRSLAGVKLVHVPYQGSGQSMQDLLGGQHLVAFDTMPASAPHVRSGRLRALATTGAQRSPALPDIPTVAGSGIPGYEASLWYGFLGPARIPADIVQRLNAEIVSVLRLTEVRERLANEGVDTQFNTPDEFARLLVSDLERWAKVIERAGVRVE
jgi:tripartite-type tricarboxylate transporter receptor subunit TctC